MLQKKTISESKRLSEGVVFYDKREGFGSNKSSMSYSYFADLMSEPVFQGGKLLSNQIYSNTLRQKDFDYFKSVISKIVSNPKVLKKDPDNIYLAKKINDVIKNIDNVDDFGVD